MTDEELIALIRENMAFIAACQAGLSQQDMVAFADNIQKLNTGIEFLKSSRESIDIEDIDTAYKELYAYYDQLRIYLEASALPLQFKPESRVQLDLFDERYSQGNFLPIEGLWFPVTGSSKAVKEDLIELYPILGEKIAYAAYNVLVASEIEGKDAFRYAIEHDIPIGQQFFDWRIRCGGMARGDFEIDKKTIFDYAYKQKLSIVDKSLLRYAIDNNVEMKQEILDELLLNNKNQINQEDINAYAARQGLLVSGQDPIQNIMDSGTKIDFSEAQIKNYSGDVVELMHYCLENDVKIGIRKVDALAYAASKDIKIDQGNFNDYFKKIKSGNKKTLQLAVVYADKHDLDIDGMPAAEYACRHAVQIDENKDPYEYMESKGLEVSDEVFNAFIKSAGFENIRADEKKLERIVGYAIKHDIKIENVKELFRGAALFDTIDNHESLFDIVVHKASYVKIDQEIFNDYVKKNNLIQNGKIHDHDIIRYASDKKIKIEGKNPIVFSEGFDEDLYKKVYTKTRDFFDKVILNQEFVKDFRVKDDIFRSWVRYMKEKKCFDEEESKMVDSLDLKSIERLREKLSEINDALKEKGVSAILRSKRMGSLANLVDGFAQFFLSIIHRSRKQIVFDTTLKQVYRKKPKN